MAWKQQPQDCAWVAGEAPFIFDAEYKSNFIQAFKTVLISTIEGEGVGNQPFGKFFNDADGHAEINFLSALQANDWVFDQGYQEIVVRINNSPCRNCCQALETFMDNITIPFPNATMVIDAANIYHPNQAADQAALAQLARHPAIRVDYWNVALESAQNLGPVFTPQQQTARIRKSMRTADRMNQLG